MGCQEDRIPGREAALHWRGQGRVWHGNIEGIAVHWGEIAHNEGRKNNQLVGGREELSGGIRGKNGNCSRVTWSRQRKERWMIDTRPDHTIPSHTYHAGNTVTAVATHCVPFIVDREDN